MYAWPLYLLMGFRMQLMADFVGFSQGRIGRSPLRFPRGWPGVGVFAGKALFLGWTFLIPILMGFPWWGVLGCYIVVVGRRMSRSPWIFGRRSRCDGQAVMTIAASLVGVRGLRCGDGRGRVRSR